MCSDFAPVCASDGRWSRAQEREREEGREVKKEERVTGLAFLLLASRARCLCSSSLTVVLTRTPW